MSILDFGDYIKEGKKMKKLFLAILALSLLVGVSNARIVFDKPDVGEGSAGDIRYVLKTGDEMTGVLTNDAIYYTNVDFGSFDSLKDAVDYLLYTSPEVTTFTNSVSVAEKGATVSANTLDWTVNKTITYEAIDSGVGVLTPATLRTVDDNASYTTNNTWTLTVADTVQNDTDTTTLYFRDKAWHGASSEATVNDAGILALATGAFATSRASTFSITPAAQYIYVAYPASFGTATFKVNGLANTDWTLSVQSHENASGYAVNYNVYRTNNL